MDVWVAEGSGYYTVWVDGVIYETLWLRKGPPLTWSQQLDMAGYYREGLLQSFEQGSVAQSE